MTYPSNNSIILLSSRPPNTLNFLILHTCVCSYLPNVIVFTIAGWCNFKTRYCGGLLLSEVHLDDWSLFRFSLMFLYKRKRLSNSSLIRNLDDTGSISYYRL